MKRRPGDEDWCELCEFHPKVPGADLCEKCLGGVDDEPDEPLLCFTSYRETEVVGYL